MSKEILTSAESYFTEVVETALESRRVEASPEASSYLVSLLNFYIVSDNLNGSPAMRESFAETLLKAAHAQNTLKLEMLKSLGDTSLYITGFFGDSLKRKIIDIDYYADIGGVAYQSLAVADPKGKRSQIYEEFAAKFMDFVDVLTYISQKSLIQSNADLIRLYDRYISTGSELAKEQLVENGILNIGGLKKASEQ